MKDIIVIIISLFFVNIAFATTNPKPEKIYRITEVQKSGEYYVQQYDLWKIELEKDKTNEDAWYNYFVAARYSNLFGGKTHDLNKIVEDVQTTIPNTFTSNYLKYWSNSWKDDYFKHLEAAYNIDPKRYETYHNFLSHYQVLGEATKAQEFAQKWYETGVMSNTMLAWAYNLLMSVDDDAIVLTHGDNDTYYPWVLQYVQNVQRGVEVVNIHLLQMENYQTKVFSDLDLPQFTQKYEDFETPNDYVIALTKHLTNHSKRPIYFSQTLHSNIKNEFKNNLYLTGLASLYSTSDVSNLAIIKNNIENRFATDYLKMNLGFDRSQGLTNQMNLMYLESYLMLYKHYNESGEVKKANEIKTLVTKIAKNGKRWDKVKKYFGQTDAKQHNYPDLDLKELQKKYVAIKGNLWAAETELSVGDYDVFLMNLVKNKDFERVSICKSEKTDWKNFLIDNHKNLGDKVIFRHGHPDDAQMPVQNISYEAAVEYCEWLTKAYNQSTYKKKKFKKVVFRLPTESEWELAARGGNKSADYAWGGYYVTNAKGCYLLNIDVTDGKPCKDCEEHHPANDGGFFTVPADAYFPNNFGLYNVCGNVAEMTSNKGVARGGSWNTKPENSKVTSKQNYSEPSPSLGFRVFMEVIKE